MGFEEALAEGRVRVDNPTDFNTMVRLKEFVQGGADSRQELHASFSLEGLQARHAQALRAARETTTAVRGEVDAEVVTSSDDEVLDTASSESPNDDTLVDPPIAVTPPADPLETPLQDSLGDGEHRLTVEVHRPVEPRS
ncbi:hypothetical protein [Myxococcus hansupus]|nr:hypothetical protein [Myxococcus hansupus]